MSNQAITLALQTVGIAHAEKLLLIVLANYANTDMECWPSHDRLAQDTCMARRTIIRTTAALAKLGLVSVRHRARKGMKVPNLYKLTFRSDMMAHRCDIDGLPDVTLTTVSGDTVSHKPSLTQKEPSRAREAPAVQRPASRAFAEPKPRRFPMRQPPTETPAEMAARLRALAR